MKLIKSCSRYFLTIISILVLLVNFFALVPVVEAINRTNTPATLVIGQPDLNSGEANQGGNISANTLYWPLHAYVYADKLFIADCHNNRVLIYNSIPTSNNASADVVIGQPDMTSGEVNQGGSPAANTLYCPYHVYVANNKLFIVDRFNNRVLIYNSIPTSNNASADVVIGQPDMTSGAANQGGSPAANTLEDPTSVYVADNKLFIVDRFNNRVLIYNSIPTSNNASADVVIGQPDMTSNLVNQGGSPAANTFYLPNDIDTVGSKLIVSDLLNHRVLIYNSIPTSNNASADVVIGQPDMTSNLVNQGGSPAANTLYAPLGVYSDDTRIFISDFHNHRLLIYNSIPTSNNASADVVIGQPDFSSNSKNQGGSTAANTLTFPVHVTSNDSYLFVPDDSETSLVNNRVLLYPLGPQNISVTAPSDTQHRDIIVSLTADDAKQIKISEDSSFSGVDWQDYSNTVNFTLSENKGEKTVYVKFRDYANYEKTLSFNVVYTPVVSTGLPAGFNNPPSRPTNSDFKVIINNGDKITNSRHVKLRFVTGSDTARIAISEDPEFKHAPLLDYKPEMDFDLSEGEGEKTIYVKYYTKYGYATKPISASIILQLNKEDSPIKKDTQTELEKGQVKGVSSVNLTDYKLKLVKYSDSPTVYLIDENNRKNPFFNEKAFIAKGYRWEDIIIIDPSITFADGEMIKYDEQTDSIITERQTKKQTVKFNSSYTFTEYLFLGYCSPQVRNLQRLLKKLNYFTYHTATGYFGPITERAVKAFQKDYNLPQTGTVGPMTRRVLNSL